MAVICLMIIGNTPVVFAQIPFSEVLFNIKGKNAFLQYALEPRAGQFQNDSAKITL